MVSHNLSSDIDNLCESVKTNANLSSFSHIYFDKFGSEDKHNLEEDIYDMMATFKTTPLEFANPIPKSLYERVEKKWKFNLETEKKIRETTLVTIMLELKKE